MISTLTPSDVSSRAHARWRVSPPPRIIARQRTSMVTRMRVRGIRPRRRAAAPTIPGTRAPRCVWRGRALDDAVVEQRTPRLERMRHRRAIHFDEDVAGQIVLLIPPLQTRQQRPL